MGTVKFLDLGLVDYEAALRRQEQAVSDVASGGTERVFLLEHPHVITLGRRAREGNLIAQRGPDGARIAIHRINRGGDITYHGPGQLVGYPHLDLNRRRRDLHGYLRNLEQSLIQTVAAFGVCAFQRPGLTGVWTDAGKLASIGIGVRRWVTMHGFALNVATDLRFFRLMHPCGIRECPMTSLERLTGSPVSMELVKSKFEQAFVAVFGPEVSGEPAGGKGMVQSA